MKKLKNSIRRKINQIKYYVIGVRTYSLIKRIYSPNPLKGSGPRFKGQFTVKCEDNKTFQLYNNAFYIETSFFWHGFEKNPWELEFRKIWVKLCAQSSTIFDIGANSGIFSVLAKSYNSSAEVYAFEPQPNIYSALSKNTEVNNFKIQCNQMALSNKPGTVPFYNYGMDTFSDINTTAGSLNNKWREKDQFEILVEAETLDNYTVKHAIKSIDLIKMDVETHEFEVLEGYLENVALHKPIILLEVLDKEIGNKIQHLFKSEEYSFYEITEEKGLQSIGKIGHSELTTNYVICPNSKKDILDQLKRNPAMCN